MKSIRIILIAIIAAFMTACHSQKPSTSLRSTSGKDKKAATTKVALTGKADNEVTKKLIDEAYKWIGTPYKLGGTSKDGTDCSGLVMNVYKNSLGINLPRVSGEQGEFCRTIKRSELMPGDLVFFSSGKGKINHVGIYIGDNKMLHASSSQGVMVCDLSLDYFERHFHSAGMVPTYREKVVAAARTNKKNVNTDLNLALNLPSDITTATAMPDLIKEKSDNTTKIISSTNDKFSKKSKAQKKGSSLKKNTSGKKVAKVNKDIAKKKSAIEKKPTIAKKNVAAKKPSSTKKEVVANKEGDATNYEAPKIKLPVLPPLQPDSTIEMQADTVHLMVYSYPKILKNWDKNKKSYKKFCYLKNFM